MAPIDVLSVGRVSVDLYATEQGVGFDGQQTFTKSVGGSPTNVAVAAARLGRRAAIATKVGDDGFGEYVRRRLAGWGVDDRLRRDASPAARRRWPWPRSTRPRPRRWPSTAVPRHRTRTLVDDRHPGRRHPDRAACCGSARVPSPSARPRDACMAWLARARPHGPHRPRPRLPRRPVARPPDGARGGRRRRSPLSTVVVGNREECHMAVGTDDPDAAADALLAARRAASPSSSWAPTARCWPRPTAGGACAPVPVAVVCGLGAGDAFGGALSHGLLSGWDIARIGRFANAAGAFVLGPAHLRRRDAVGRATSRGW